jgi:septum formation inhibitor MinC
MKKIKLIIILAFAISFNLSAQNGIEVDDFIYTNKKPIERKVSSVVSHVIVFNTQAQVTRTAKVNLEAGVFNIVFDKLSPYINMNSLEVKANAGLTILSVSNRNDFLNKNEKPNDILILEDSLTSINAALADFKADKETIVHQKDLMLANRNVASNQTGVKADDLDDLMSW